MAWRLAKSLITLRDQINIRYPDRSKASDGSVGDLRHQQLKSDHNPREGVVTAIDITHDPKAGPDLTAMIPMLLADPRTKYIIFNKRIYNQDVAKGAGRPYLGSNEHRKHLHLSVDWDKHDQAQPWKLTPMGSEQPPTQPAPVQHETIKKGSSGKLVIALQLKLKELGYYEGKVDGKFGPVTEVGVKSFQSDKSLKPDGVVGPVTWAALQEPVAKPMAEGEYKQDLTKPDHAVKFLEEELGWSRIAAVALIANIVWESAGNADWRINYMAHGDRGKDGQYHSHGAGQWNDKHGRYDDLLNYAVLHGVPWTDPQTQLRFLDHELQGKERKVAEALREATTLTEAVNAAIKLWRPGIPHAEKRMAIAKKIYGTAS